MKLRCTIYWIFHSVLHPPVTFPLLGPNIHLPTSFSMYFLSATNHISLRVKLEIYKPTSLNLQEYKIFERNGNYHSPHSIKVRDRIYNHTKHLPQSVRASLFMIWTIYWHPQIESCFISVTIIHKLIITSNRYKISCVDFRLLYRWRHIAFDSDSAV